MAKQEAGPVSVNLNVDVNNLIHAMNSTGCGAESGERKFHNDWKARDQYAHQQGTFDYGRRSERVTGLFGIPNGTAYYALSALGAMKQGIKLDSMAVYERLAKVYLLKKSIRFEE